MNWAIRRRWRSILILARRNAIVWAIVAVVLTVGGYPWLALIFAFAAGMFAEDWWMARQELKDIE